MKKFIYAALAATILFAACNKQGDNNAIEPSDEELSSLTIKISQVQQTKATTVPGQTGELKIVDGWVYIFDNNGSLVQVKDAGGNLINPQKLELTGDNSVIGFSGQVLEGKFPATSRVYIIANIPEQFKGTTPTLVDNFTSLARLNLDSDGTRVNTEYIQGDVDVKGDGTDIVDYYKVAALANHDGQPASIEIISAGKGRVDITLKPLMSRIELQQVKSADYFDTATEYTYSITNYEVTGVFVDGSCNAFTFTGAPAGDREPQNQSKVFDNSGFILKNKLGDVDDTGKWAANAGVVIAEANKVWAYQVPACVLPRFLIRLKEEVGFQILTKSGVAPATSPFGADIPEHINYTVTTGAGTFKVPMFITVSGYNGITEFERGKIYRVGGTNGIVFNFNDLYPVPNPENVDLTVHVTVEDWILVDAEPYL